MKRKRDWSQMDKKVGQDITKFAKFLKENPISLVISFLLIIFIPFLIEFIFYISPGHGNRGDWLGFWGGYLGSIIAIAGVGWTVIEGKSNLKKSLDEEHSNLETSLKEQRDELDETLKNQEIQLKETLKNEKEQQFRASRPFFYFERLLSKNSLGTLYHSSLAFGEKFGKLNEYLHRSSSRDILVLRNISGKRMMKVMIKLHYKNGIPTEVFKIGLVNADDSAYLINRIAFNKDWDDIYSYSDINNSYENLNEVEIFFTTELRERIRLVFDYKIIKIDSIMEQIFEYDEDSKILENKIKSDKDLSYLDEKYTEGGFNPTIAMTDPI